MKWIEWGMSAESSIPANKICAENILQTFTLSYDNVISEKVL